MRFSPVEKWSTWLSERANTSFEFPNTVDAFEVALCLRFDKTLFKLPRLFQNVYRTEPPCYSLAPLGAGLATQRPEIHENCSWK